MSEDLSPETAVHVTPGGVPRSDQAAFLEELKRHNEMILNEHKKVLEAQYQSQLSAILSQFRPQIPVIATRTKIALNQVEADARIDLFYKKASSLDTAPKMTVYEKGQKAYEIRMSTDSKPEPAKIVSKTDGGSIDEENYNYSEGYDLDSFEETKPKQKGVKDVPLHPSLKNSVYGKPVASSSQLSAISGPKAEKKKDIVIRKHNMKETIIPEVKDDELDGLFDKMDSNTKYMLKKTAFILEDSSSSMEASQQKRKPKKKVKRKRFNNEQVGDSYDSTSGGAGKTLLGSAGFNSMFDYGEGFEIQDEDDDVLQSTEKYEHIEDNVEAGRNASSQGVRRGSKVVFGGTSEVYFPPVESVIAPLGSSSSRPSSGSSALKKSSGDGRSISVVEFNGTEKLPLIDGAFEETKLGLPDGWDRKRVNNYEYAIDPHMANSKVEWENEIARHVLSVYATAKVKDSAPGSNNRHKAEYVVDFVDVNKEDNLETVKTYCMSEDGLGDRETQEWEQYVAEEESIDYHSEHAHDDELAAGGHSPSSITLQTLKISSPPPPKSDKYGLQKPKSTASQKLLNEFADVVVVAQQAQTVKYDQESTYNVNGVESGGSVGSLERSISSSVIDEEEARDKFPSFDPNSSQIKTREMNKFSVSRGSVGLSSRGSVQSNNSGNFFDSAAKRPQKSNESSTPKPDGTITAHEAGLKYAYEESFRKSSKFRSVTIVTMKPKPKIRCVPFSAIKNPKGEEIALRGSPRCFPIWFITTSEIYANWSRLPGGLKLQARLTDFYEKRQYTEYLGIIERIIDNMWRDRKLGKQNLDDFTKKRKSTRPRVLMDPGVLMDRTTRSPSPTRERVNAGNPLEPLAAGGSGIMAPSALFPQGYDASASDAAASTKNPWIPAYADEDSESIWTKQKREDEARVAAAEYLSDNELIELWSQLILTANAVGILCIEKKKVDLGLEILTSAEEWCNRDDILPKKRRNTLRAHVHDAMAFFFYKKGKSMSATSYTNLALEVHENDCNIECIGIGLLHVSAIQSQLGNFKGAHKTLYQFLAMVEDGRLSFEEATPKQLCMVAVAYHNLAVVQLKLLVPDLACKSSQNARKIARLCLSFSNRWMHIFQWTHDLALEDVRFQLTERPGIPLSKKQLQIIKTLTMAMYNDEPC